MHALLVVTAVVSCRFPNPSPFPDTALRRGFCYVLEPSIVHHSRVQNASASALSPLHLRLSTSTVGLAYAPVLLVHFSLFFFSLCREYFLLVADHFWIVTYVSQGIVLLLNPIAW